MTEQQVMMQQMHMVMGLAWLAVVLFVLMITKEGLGISRIIRRYMGMNLKINGDPIDDLTFGQFRTRMDEHDAAVMKLAAQVETSFLAAQDKRFNAIDRQLEISRRKDNNMLIIMRDLRAFMIYQERPKTRDLPPLEGDEEGRA